MLALLHALLDRLTVERTVRRVLPPRQRNLVVILLVSLLVASAWFGLRARKSSIANLHTVVDSTLTGCAADPACVESETERLVNTFGVVAVVKAAHQAYKGNSSLLPNCHRYMHRLGAYVTPIILGSTVPDFDASWTDCGAGLVHGTFENIPVSETQPDALREVLALCETPELSETKFLYHSCIHAVGHAIHSGVGARLSRGETLCYLVEQDDSFAQNHPCLAGLYMADRDTRLVKTLAPKTISGWDALLVHCARSPQHQTCVLAYAELAVRGGPESALSYLDWCIASDVTPTVCLRFVGQGGAFAQLTVPDGALNAGTCLRAAEDRGLMADACMEGVENALSARGTPVERLRIEACELVRRSGRDCREIGF